MAVIKQQDFIDSIFDALQFISYYHPLDFVEAMKQAYDREQSPAAKDAIAQILINSRMAAEGHRPRARTPASSPVLSKWGCRCNGMAR